MGALAEEAVDAINAVYGGHAGERASHAKGVICGGTFTATPEAAALTVAEHMQGGEVRATVRFSNSSGDPASPDHARDVRGLATKLSLPSGECADIVAVSMPCFVARTPSDFLDFTRATIPSRRRPLRIARHLIRHREAWRAAVARTRLRPPASFATCRFNALHAFRWLDPEGRARHVRYSWAPLAGEASLRPRRARGLGPDYLAEELRERLEQAPVRFDLELQLARDGDDVDDPTKPWPRRRERVLAGTLEVDRLGAEPEPGDDPLVFDPVRAPDGIEPSDDPILRFRPAAYAVSADRRSAVAA